LNVRSIALITELGLAVTRGKITDRGDYLVVQTPDDPGYYYGNLLVLPAAPLAGEVAHWMQRFADELGAPDIHHVTLWWDGITGDEGPADELRAAGFTLETSQVMIADDVRGLDSPPSGEVRKLTPDEVLHSVELGWAIADRHDDAYRTFLQRRVAWHRDLVVRGRATFWGAHDGDELVASLGLVELGTLARYQDVQTLPAYRRRGLATALLAAAAREAFGASNRDVATRIERVVIIAEPGSDAARVYERAGFRAIERTTAACRYPPGTLATRASRSPA